MGVDYTCSDWYSSSLGPTELLAADSSAPLGLIPHGLVVQLSELSLDEVIGEGAEGKVRVMLLGILFNSLPSWHW